MPAAAPPPKLPADLSLIPADARLICTVKPGAIAAGAGVRVGQLRLPFLAGWRANLGLRLNAVERFSLVADDGGITRLLVVRTSRRIKRLAVLSQEASLIDAARILANRDTPLIVVCDSDGIAVGVISSSHVINVLATAGVDACGLNAGAIMTKPLLSCHVDQNLQEVWAVMSSRTLPCAPILDNDGRAQGVLHARDVAIALLDEVTHEELLLRDYVMGVGYQ